MPLFAPLGSAAWLEKFYAGNPRLLEACYREHVGRALSAARRVVPDIDAETVVHEVFYRLLSDESMRRGFTGGNFGAWVVRVTTNLAIDMRRRRGFEVDPPDDARTLPVDERSVEDEIDAKALVERFRRERLPEKWRPVFEARFLRQLTQRQAASELRIQRSTLVYQEQQIRELLTAFLLETEQP